MATTAFKWNAAKEQALWLVFAGNLSQAEVAENVGVATRTCERWVAHPVFRSRLEQMRADLNASLKATLYVSKESRIMALSDMALKARSEFEARPWLKEVRPTKDGAVTNESFNGDAFAAFRGALDDIAKELGERKATSADADAHTFRLIIETDNDGHTHVSNGNTTDGTD